MLEYLMQLQIAVTNTCWRPAGEITMAQLRLRYFPASTLPDGAMMTAFSPLAHTTCPSIVVANDDDVAALLVVALLMWYDY